MRAVTLLISLTLLILPALTIPIPEEDYWPPEEGPEPYPQPNWDEQNQDDQQQQPLAEPQVRVGPKTPLTNSATRCHLARIAYNAVETDPEADVELLDDAMSALQVACRYEL